MRNASEFACKSMNYRMGQSENCPDHARAGRRSCSGCRCVRDWPKGIREVHDDEAKATDIRDEGQRCPSLQSDGVRCRIGQKVGPGGQPTGKGAWLDQGKPGNPAFRNQSPPEPRAVRRRAKYAHQARTDTQGEGWVGDSVLRRPRYPYRGSRCRWWTKEADGPGDAAIRCLVIEIHRGTVTYGTTKESGE